MDRSGDKKQNQMTRIAAAALIAAVIAVLVVFGKTRLRVDERGRGEAVTTRELYAMDTIMELTVYEPEKDETMDEAVQIIRKLEAELSAHDAASALYALNENGSGTFSGEAGSVFSDAVGYSCDEAIPFNAALYPVMRLWGFDEETHRLPQEDDIRDALQLSDPRKAELETTEDGGLYVVYETPGMAFDLGGIVKGYASKRVLDAFRERGIHSALINLGGNVVTLGSKPDGSDFRVGIRDPKGGYFGVVEVSDQAVVTSGGYERFFELDGVRYHHILDPETGYPSDSGLVSATAVCADPVYADVMSTSLFIMGMEDAAAYWRKNSDRFDMVLLDEDGRIFVTEGIAERFRPKGYEVTVLTKEN